jgi:hypothetical protein
MMGCWRNMSMKRIMGFDLAFVGGASPTIFFLFTATVLSVLAGDAIAAEWQFNPQVELGALSNDNYRMNLPGESQAVNGLETDVQAQLRAVTDVTDFRFTPELRATYFPDNHFEDETDPYLNINWNYNGQRLKTSLAMNYSDVSIVLPTAGIGENPGQVGTVGGGPGTGVGGLGNPTTGDSGYIDIENRQQTINIMPTLDFEFAPHRHFQVTANYGDVKFDQNVEGSFVGFKSEGGTVGLSQDLTQRDALTLRAIIGYTQPASTFGGTLGDTSSYGGVAEWTRHFSEIAQAYVRIGDEVTHFDPTIVAATQSQTGVVAAAQTQNATIIPAHNQNTWVAAGGFVWTYPISQIFLDLDRSVDPNTSGYVVTRDQLRLLATHDFTARLSGLLGVAALEDTSTGSGTGFAERKYATANVGVQWRYSRAWTLKGSYTYTWQRYQGYPTIEDSNAFIVAVVYQPYRDRK